MALNFINSFAGKVNPANADFPYGEPRNESAPKAGDGFPWIDSVVKDIFGFLHCLLLKANIVPTGNSETAQVSQFYDALIAIIKSNSSGGAGGGQWFGPDGESPIEAEENGERVWLFSKGEEQKLVLFLKVPVSYSVGSPIKSRLSFYSPGSNGIVTNLLKTKTYLIRKNTDTISSVVNLQSSTNVAVAPDSANQYREIEVSISDGDGKVNLVVVNPGDLLRVELSRGVDTDPEDVRFIPSATEVLF